MSREETSGEKASQEEMVRQVVEEVLRRLNPASLSPDAAASGRRVMVVITGATIGAQAALEGLIRLKERRGSALEYIVLFSRAAAEIHRLEEVGKKLCAPEVLVEGKNARGRAIAALKRCDLVAVPALTRATAARLAFMFTNSSAAGVIVDALMRGLPVVAARDAADPTSEGYARLGMNRGSPALVQTMLNNLERIAGYGVVLASSNELGRALEQRLWDQAGPEEKTPPVMNTAGPTLRHLRVAGGVHTAESSPLLSIKQPGQRVIITREELGALVGSDGVVRTPRGAMITPLVRDIIRDAGWRVEET